MKNKKIFRLNKRYTPSPRFFISSKFFDNKLPSIFHPITWTTLLPHIECRIMENVPQSLKQYISALAQLAKWLPTSRWVCFWHAYISKEQKYPPCSIVPTLRLFAMLPLLLEILPASGMFLSPLFFPLNSELLARVVVLRMLWCCGVIFLNIGDLPIARIQKPSQSLMKTIDKTKRRFIIVINLMVVQLSREEPMIEILITDYLILAAQRCETLQWKVWNTVSHLRYATVRKLQDLYCIISTVKDCRQRL